MSQLHVELVAFAAAFHDDVRHRAEIIGRGAQEMAVLVAYGGVRHQRRVDRDARSFREARARRDADAQRMPSRIVGDHLDRLADRCLSPRDIERRAVGVQPLVPVAVSHEQSDHGAAFAEHPDVAARIDRGIREAVAFHRRESIGEPALAPVEVFVLEPAAAQHSQTDAAAREPPRRRVPARVQLHRVPGEMVVGQCGGRVAERGIHALRVVAADPLSAAQPVARADFVGLRMYRRNEKKREQEQAMHGAAV